tara:strand:+ start:2132 stop:2440 length:309 start_codon:yes stop_codon:yes gene_type:complete
MRTLLALLIFASLFFTNAHAQGQNPRLRNFRHGTGQAGWWEQKATPVARPQVIYYPPALRYYYPMPRYGHFSYCHCHICKQRRAMWQMQVNPQRFFFFQFRF